MINYFKEKCEKKKNVKFDIYKIKYQSHVYR